MMAISCGSTLPASQSKSIDVTEDAIEEVKAIDSFYLQECYWPDLIQDELMTSAFFNLQEFAEALEYCATRHNGLIIQLK